MTDLQAGMPVDIISMRLMRHQVLNVRAMFTVDIGPIRLIDCYLKGTRQQAPDTFTIALPGRWSKDGSSWKTVVLAAPALEAEIQKKALVVYQRLVEPSIERNSPAMPDYLYAPD